MAFDDMEQIIPEALQSSLKGRKLLIVLVFVIVLLVLMVVGLSAALAHKSMSNKSGEVGENIAGSASQLAQDGVPCKTSMMDSFSMNSLQALNSSISYCDNFYQYACGGWIKTHEIPPDRASVSTWSQMSEENEERIRELLEEPIKRDTPDSMERKIKLLYKMCLHDYGRSKQGARPLLTIIKEQLGGWYTLDPDNWQNGWNLRTAFSRLQGDYMVDVFLKVYIGLSPVDYKTKVINARSGGLGMYYYSYLDIYSEYYADTQDAYKDYMRETASLLLRDANITLTPTERAARVEQFVADAYGHESQMANGMYTLRRSPGYRKTLHATINELSRNYTQIDWSALFNGMFQEVTHLGGFTGSPITDETKVVIRPKGYFDFLEEVFLNETANRDRIFNNYMVWRLVDTYASHLSWEYMYARLRYEETRSGRSEFAPSWKRCVNMIRERLPQGLGGLISQKHSSVASKKQIEKMVNNIKQAYFERFDEVEWIDNITSSRAKLKLNATKDQAILPDKWFDQSFMDNLYKHLTINEADSYFKNFMNTNQNIRVFRIKEMSVSYDYSVWMSSLQSEGMDIHPQYFYFYNALLIPLGSVHIPMFNSDALKFANYGAMGTAIAYELANSVNDLGRYQWINGSYVDWWTVESAADYMKAENCFRNYFTGIKLGPFKLDGTEEFVVLDGSRRAWMAVDEQAATRAAYNAYSKWSNGNLPEAGLGTLTVQQAFFVSAAQTQCAKMRDTHAYRRARSGNIPTEQLVNGVYRNMPEFATAFNCAPNSNMVAPPTETCSVF